MFELRNFILLLFCFVTFLVKGQSAENQYVESIERGVSGVKTIDWTRFEDKSKSSPQQIMAGKILLNANKYALTSWWKKRGFAGTPSGDYLDLKGTTEHKIRPVAAEAESMAASLRTGLYDSSITGVTTAEAEAKTIQMIRSLGHSHIANSKEGWGRKWQSALWAGYTGFAAWMMWDKLDEQTRFETMAMIYDECDWIMNDKGLLGIKTYQDLHGKIVSPGDTGAEENAWDSLILSVACAMMPENPNHSIWMNKMIFLNINALACPSDLKLKKKYNGKPLNEWLVGTNINEDGTVVNHHFIHPDYMTSPFEFNPIKFFWLAQKPAPSATKRNVDLVFNAFTKLNFHEGDSITGGVVKSPGGTIYKSGSGDIFYPLGTDWGEGRRMNFASFNSTVGAFSDDHGIRSKALEWELNHGQVVLDMQSRFEDGHTYLDKSEDSFASCEEWVADKAATVYIIETLKLLEKPKFTNKKF
ncbi:hypothetical protein IFO69_14720 [Echinicola sp. CAU 1574]|uniref:Uncharacterized protein n=1 Tax=Echinicola arenosa TaxID=2774144 RepID=A0ABR9AQ62_9BACT|nr:hypothetical protein [Echinicola arenosa]MBD8490008.1 hypothetical protein [Echinicola arenosa]